MLIQWKRISQRKFGSKIESTKRSCKDADYCRWCFCIVQSSFPCKENVAILVAELPRTYQFQCFVDTFDVFGYLFQFWSQSSALCVSIQKFQKVSATSVQYYYLSDHLNLPAHFFQGDERLFRQNERLPILLSQSRHEKTHSTT